MKSMVTALCLGLFATSIARSQTATFTFESAQWMTGQLAPFLSKTPDSGWSGLTADFTCGPGVPMTVGSAALSPAFSGKNLYQPGGPGDNANSSTLLVSLSSPVNAVRVDFSLFSLGHLNFTSSAGNSSQGTGLTMSTGTLVFSSPTAFTQFSLAGFNSGDARLLFAIDNLVVAVPEPAIGTLLLLALVSGFGTLRRGKSRA